MRLLLVAGVLSAAFLAAYLPDIGHGFLRDDFRWILSSRSTGLTDLLALFESNVGFYRPLVSVTFAADHAVWGLNPFGYALTNLALCGGCAALLYGLSRRLTLPGPAALAAAAVWAFNFHGVNMALLWLSGRTSLLVTIFSLATAHAVLAGSRLAGGLFCLAALLCKEEAVPLPPLFTAFLYATRPSGERPGKRLRYVSSQAWPLWTALGIYAVLRLRSGAFGPFDAPPFYQFSSSPALVLRNLLEYTDRSATLAAAVVLLAIVFARRLPSEWTLGERRALALGGIWMASTMALIVWLPLRSSLYALPPSIGSSLAAGAVGSWALRAHASRVRALAVCLPLLVVLLIPVYRSRNVRWVEPADLSRRVMDVTTSLAAQAATPGRIVLIDAPNERVNLDAVFATLLPDAVTLFLGSRWTAEILAPGETVPADARVAVQFDDGRLIPLEVR